MAGCSRGSCCRAKAPDSALGYALRREIPDLALAAPELAGVAVRHRFGDAHGLDIVGGLDFLEADEPPLWAVKQVETVISHASPRTFDRKQAIR